MGEGCRADSWVHIRDCVFPVGMSAVAGSIGGGRGGVHKWSAGVTCGITHCTLINQLLLPSIGLPLQYIPPVLHHACAIDTLHAVVLSPCRWTPGLEAAAGPILGPLPGQRAAGQGFDRETAV